MLMLWLILCLSAAAIWGISAFFDNYLTDVIFKNRTPQAMKAINGPTYLIFAVILAICFGNSINFSAPILILLLSGVLHSVGSIFYYNALKGENATGAAIFYQLQPLLFLAGGFLLFGESISPQQILGFILILLAPIVVILSKRRNSRRMEMRAALLLIIYVIFATVSSGIAVRVGHQEHFITVFTFFLVGRGASDLLISFVPKIRRRHHYIMEHDGAKYITITLLNQIICTAADFMYRYGLILGIAALASAFTNAAELILTFLFGIIFSIIWPKFGREKLNRRDVLAHIVAVILCAIGIFVIQ